MLEFCRSISFDETFKLDNRKHLATKRVVKHWNRLPREEAPSLSVFKRHLDNALNNML